MKKLPMLVVLVLLTLFANSVWAAWSGLFAVQGYKALGQDMIVVLDGFVNESGVECDSHEFILLKESRHADLKSRLVRDAAQTERPVSFTFSECHHDGRIKIERVNF